MIYRLKSKHYIDFIDCVASISDKYQDFYVTINKNRNFMKDANIAKKILNNQEVFGFMANDLLGIMLIYKEKGYRPYLKILAINEKIIRHLIKYLNWHFNNIDLFIKLKKDNPLVRILQKQGFNFRGGRGTEILLFRKGRNKNIGAKTNGKNYSQDKRPNRR